MRTLVFFWLSGSLLANAQLKTSDTDVLRDSYSLPMLPQSADDVIVVSSVVSICSSYYTCLDNLFAELKIEWNLNK